MPVTTIDEFLEQNAHKDLLRFSTAGSVDDGKSTLIGRLLHDSKCIYEDQLSSVKNASGKINNEVEIDFALLTDGLKAEREQGITIDVAYRYFSTPKRKFIIADTPGHEQYTRNMATGASTANLAIILIDARHGVLTQSKRHSFIASLLGIPHFLIAINKMDLVDYSQEVFEKIRQDYSDFAAKLNVRDLHFIPLSALHGDNVVTPGHENMPWYKGSPLLEYLENVYIASDRNLIDLRFPVQYVIRPDLDFRGFAGQVASGIIKKNDKIMVLPSRKKSRVKSIVTFDGELEQAFPPQSVTVTLEDDIDISHGDMLVHTNNIPHTGRHFEAMLVWMDEKPMNPYAQYIIKHTSNSGKVRIDKLRYRVDVNSLHHQETEALKLNEIGRVVLTVNKALYFDPYARNHQTGCFILIDVVSNNTVAAGTIIDRISEDRLPSRIFSATQVVDGNRTLISREDRIKRLNQKPATLWLTGLHASGKNNIAYLLEKRLFDMGASCIVFDGNLVRRGLNRELDFSATDRAEHLRRVAETAKTINENGLIAICVFVSPDADIRNQVAKIIGSDFIEIHVDTSVEKCREADTVGLYEKADRGEIANLPGVDAPYEKPENPALLLDMNSATIDESVETIIRYLEENSIFPVS